MKNKKNIVFNFPIILLLIYAIIYIPLFRIIYLCMEAKSKTLGNVFGAYQVSEVINKISYLIIIVSVIMKILFNAKKCEISKKKSAINMFIFVILIIFIMFFLRLATSFA